MPCREAGHCVVYILRLFLFKHFLDFKKFPPKLVTVLLHCVLHFVDGIAHVADEGVQQQCNTKTDKGVYGKAERNRLCEDGNQKENKKKKADYI